MKINKMDHIGINVVDLPAAIEFFVDIGLEVVGEGEVEGAWVDRVIGLKDVKSKIVMLTVPGSQTNIELVKFHHPKDEQATQKPLANTLGIRHIAFEVDDIKGIIAKLKKKGTETFSEIQQYEYFYKLCYVRSPEGIILELAEKIG